MNTKHFTAAEVKEIWLKDEAVAVEEGESRRWLKTIGLIVKRDNKYYSLYFNQGLTECQKDEFEDQDAPEVKLIEETVVIKKWVYV